MDEDEGDQPFRDFALMAQVALTALFFLATAFEFAAQEFRTTRRWWIRPSSQIRLNAGFFECHFWQMAAHDPERFHSWGRMSYIQFETLANKVRPLLEKCGPREPLSVEEKLAITLEYLNHGTSPDTIALNFCRGRSTVSEIIPETCEAIWSVLAPIYVRPPSSPDEWVNIAEEFLNLWQIPHCMGCVDGKHVRIKAPPNSGSLFYNYKNFYSINLMAACDARCVFTLIDVGAFGSNSDAAVFEKSRFGQALRNGTLNRPRPAPLPGTNILMEYFFVGDNAFPMSQFLLTPYCRRNRDYNAPEHLLFNYRLIRGRRLIENAFGQLGSRFQVYNQTINFPPEKACHIIKATVAIHNMLRIEDLAAEDDEECRPHLEMAPGSFYADAGLITDLPSARAGKEARAKLERWFLSTPGDSICPWMYDILHAREDPGDMSQQVLTAMDRQLRNH